MNTCTRFLVGVAAACALLVSDAAALASPRALPKGAAYVALGSSFAAGPGVPPPGPECGRSGANYPSLVAKRLQLELVDVSCSGATTLNVTSEAEGDQPPQVTAVTENTALVTVTVGGNDIQYSGSTLNCAASPESCVPGLDVTAIDTAVKDLPARLTDMFRMIRSRAPKARVLLVTYPKVIPSGAPCAALGLGADEAQFVAKLGKRLERIFKDVAARSHVTLVDPYAKSDGHGPCEPDAQRWVEGSAAGPTGIAFHPNALGHRAMAKMVVQAVRGATSRSPKPTSAA
jgi:lysophospholipase L1-like esterase